METAIIAWLYVVGLCVCHRLVSGAVERHWSVVMMTVGWPITIPFALLAKRMGWLERLEIWADMKLDANQRR